ncbi:unnamed protein product [Paramecium octaurelia]|uniref:folate gamma-glutamyl hydrolase n=1 Tax=Paramecium octaurelia TaxID=43137 RepID=A0A8S1SPE4_PAROT|nr:unnamed protein product [Paramecium octaurelia]
MITKIAILVSALLIAYNQLQSTSQQLQEQPVIGIFTQPSTFAEYASQNYTYIAASYVKFLESGGARVIPIPYEANHTTLDEIFKNINGILIPGGSTGLKGPSLYTQRVAYLVNKALKINKEGGWFPIIGICLGHEVMHYILSNYSENFLIDVKGNDKVTRPINIHYRQAYFYSQMKEELYQATLNENLAYYHHIHAVSPSLYEIAPVLQQYLRITSTQTDEEGQLFITSTEGINMPFYSFQYHPEKNPFEWTIPANHSVHAIQFSRIHSYQFIQSCRMNSNKFSLDLNKLIFNYNPIQPINQNYNQVYIFQRLQAMEDAEYQEQS